MRPQLEHPTRRNSVISPDGQVFVFLRFLATGSFHSSIGDLHGVSKASHLRKAKIAAITHLMYETNNGKKQYFALISVLYVSPE